MFWLILAVVGTMSVSFTTSLFEAVVLSTTVAETEALKKTRPRRGRRLEQMKVEIDATIAVILTLNTVSNGIGSVIVGALSAKVFGTHALLFITPIFALMLLLGSEVVPKNIGVVHRQKLQASIVYPLWYVRRALAPISWLCNQVVHLFVSAAPPPNPSQEEIILLAEKGAQEGTLSKSESNIIANALTLDEVRVSAVMTPRTVVTALRRDATVTEVLSEFPTLPFGRMPVYGKNLDDVVGVVRRRDLLEAKANGHDATPVEQWMEEVHFIPETVTIADALQAFLKAHQKLLVAVDEFGATAGVITMEDVIEYLLGLEIFEKTDVAVDMREFARNKRRKQVRPTAKPSP